MSFEAFNAAIDGLTLPDPSGPTPPILFICGTPRSGTTILCQSLAYAGELGTITNLIARFASNPRLGVLLHQALDQPKTFTGRSDFGRTEGLTEPHEFGLGWTNLLGFDALQEPPPGVKPGPDAIARIELLARQFAQPVVFKSFAYIWFIEELAKALPSSLWLHVTRQPAAAAKSLEKLYKARNLDRDAEAFTSATARRTRERAAGLSLSERTRAQVDDIDAHIAGAFAALPGTRQLTLPIEDYQSDAIAATRRVLDHFQLPIDQARLESLK